MHYFSGNSTESFKISLPQKRNALHFLRIIKSIASAINKLRARSKFRPLKFFSNKHFEVLNDKSNFFDSSGKGNDHLKMLLAKNEMIRMAYKLKIWAKKTRVYRICSEKISKNLKQKFYAHYFFFLQVFFLLLKIVENNFYSLKC